MFGGQRKEKMKNKVLEIWPEINWIKGEDLRNKTLDAWVYAIENSPLEPKDLEEIPFSCSLRTAVFHL